MLSLGKAATGTSRLRLARPGLSRARDRCEHPLGPWVPVDKERKMKKETTIASALLIGSVFLIGGCGAKKAKTPKEALENMQDAIREGDIDAFMACIDATAEREEALKAFGDLTAASYEFGQAMEHAYGKGAARPFRSFWHLANEEWLDNATIKIDGDTATTTKKGVPETIKLVKMGDEWKIDGTSLIGSGQTEEAKKVVKMWAFWATVMKDAQKNIGKRGYTAERINGEVGMKMLAETMKDMPALE